MAELRIKVADDAVTSLYRWLAQDPDVRTGAEISLSDGRQGDMGAALDVINVVLSNSIALSSLVVAIATWRGSRPTTPPTVVEIERDGVRVVIHDDSPEAVRRAIAALSEES